MREKTRVVVFFRVESRGNDEECFFFEVPLFECFFCKKNTETKTIITSDAILLLLSYTNTLLHFFALSLKAYYIMMMMMLDSYDAVSRRSDREEYIHSLCFSTFRWTPTRSLWFSCNRRTSYRFSPRLRPLSIPSLSSP